MVSRERGRSPQKGQGPAFEKILAELGRIHRGVVGLVEPEDLGGALEGSCTERSCSEGTPGRIVIVHASIVRLVALHPFGVPPQPTLYYSSFPLQSVSHVLLSDLFICIARIITSSALHPTRLASAF